MKKRQIIAMLSCLIVGAAGFAGAYTTEKMENQTRLEQQAKAEEEREKEELSQKTSTVVEPKPKAVITPEEMPEEETEPAAETMAEQTTEEDTETVETAVQDGGLHFKPEEGMHWPMEGNVLLNYSMDHTIYFPTLEQYQYNPALVIGGDVNNKVYLIAKGVIKDISTNEETGCTVTQDLGDGYTAIYGQLKELNFEVGEEVERGQVIGYVNEPTKYYSVEGSNLYFAMEKDGEPINPIEYFE